MKFGYNLPRTSRCRSRRGPNGGERAALHRHTLVSLPLVPQGRLPEGVRQVLLWGRVVDEPLGAVEPERGVPAETLVQLPYLLVVGPGQVDGEPGGDRVPGARVDLTRRVPVLDRRVYAQELVEASQQLLGEEAHVLEKPHEDLLFGVERPPPLQRPQVACPETRALIIEPAIEFPVLDLVHGLSSEPEPHIHSGPWPLYGAKHHEDYLRVRHQPVDVGYGVRLQYRVVGRSLPRDPSLALLEEGGIPLVTRSLEEVPEIPRDILPGDLPWQPLEPGSDLPAPPFVDRPTSEEPEPGAALLFDPLVEVVELLFLRHPDLGVRLEVAVQPRRARLLRPYSDEVRKHQSSLLWPSCLAPHSIRSPLDRSQKSRSHVATCIEASGPLCMPSPEETPAPLVHSSHKDDSNIG